MQQYQENTKNTLYTQREKSSEYTKMIQMTSLKVTLFQLMGLAAPSLPLLLAILILYEVTKAEVTTVLMMMHKQQE